MTNHIVFICPVSFWTKLNRTKNVNVVVFKSLPHEPTTYTLFYAAATVSASSIQYKHIDGVVSKKRQHVAAGLGGNLTFYKLDHSLIPSHTWTATKFLYEDCYLNYVQREFPLNTKKIPFSKIKRKLYDALAHLLTFIKKNLSFRLKLNKDFWLERKNSLQTLFCLVLFLFHDSCQAVLSLVLCDCLPFSDEALV